MSRNIPKRLVSIKPASAALNFDRVLGEEEYRRKHPVGKGKVDQPLANQLHLFDDRNASVRDEEIAG